MELLCRLVFILIFASPFIALAALIAVTLWEVYDERRIERQFAQLMREVYERENRSAQ